MRLHRGLLALVPVLVACGSPGDDPLGTAQDAITVCAKGSTLQGIDVSHYDGTIDWAQVASSGRSFAFAKATEGDNDTDPTFATNWAGMKAAGVVRGAYHFFHCDTPAATQASYFLSVMPALEDGDLPPTLDFEDTTTCTASTGISLAVEWLDAVAKATGTLPILYSSPGILGGFSGTSALAGHAQLWVANWGVSCPTVPTPFTAWPFWQTSATGTVPGVPGSSGACDLDEFDGDLAALKAFAFGGATSTSASSSSSSSSSSAGSSPPACKVNGVDGTCIDVTTCDAMPGYVSTPGFCPGPASEECCTPTGGGSSSSSASTSSGSSSASSTSGTSGSTLVLVELGRGRRRRRRVRRVHVVERRR
jgi:lysozyme